MLTVSTIKSEKDSGLNKPKDKRRAQNMDGWTKFFVCVGVSVVVYAACQIIFWLDDPRKHHKRK